MFSFLENLLELIFLYKLIPQSWMLLNLGQIQSIKLLQNMVSNTTQHPPPPSPSRTLSVYKGRGKGCGGDKQDKAIVAITKYLFI